MGADRRETFTSSLAADADHAGVEVEIAVAKPGHGWLALAIPVSVGVSWLAILLLSGKPVLSNPRLVGSIAMAVVATGAALGVFRLRALVALGVSLFGLGVALIAGQAGGMGPASSALHCLS